MRPRLFGMRDVARQIWDKMSVGQRCSVIGCNSRLTSGATHLCLVPWFLLMPIASDIGATVVVMMTSVINTTVLLIVVIIDIAPSAYGPRTLGHSCPGHAVGEWITPTSPSPRNASHANTHALPLLINLSSL